MLTILEQWLYSVPIAVVGFYAGRFRWWLGLLILVWPAILLRAGWTFYIRDFVGESEIYDNANAFFLSILAVASVVIVAVVCGIRAGRKRTKQIRVSKPASGRSKR